MRSILCLSVIGLWLAACQPSKDPSLAEQEPTLLSQYNDYTFPAEIAQPIQQYCGSCHSAPAPDLLDKKTWQDYVLPRMGYFLGRYADLPRDSLLESPALATVFPASPLIPDSIWQQIEKFYLAAAPAQLPQHQSQDSLAHTALFTAKFPNYFLSPPSSTLVQFGKQDNIFVGDANSESLLLFDANLQLVNAAKVREGAVHLDETEKDMKLTIMGSFSPTDAAKGFILGLPTDGQRPPYLILDQLQRPVHTCYADLDQDGLTDIITCEFGKWTGSLSWWKNKGNHAYERKILQAGPGATRSVTLDLDQDGDLDILALFAQGDECLSWFENKGDGHFAREKLIQFPASFGSSFFDLIDWDQDGLLDIVYTAGDNADYPPIIKPYHGVYIFKNQGDLTFEQVFFQALPGAYKALVADFDQDDDLDIATISFFPNFGQQPNATFVLLEQEAGHFERKTFPQSTMGRWITMDMGDPDHDGDVDLLLGSLAFEVVPPSPLLRQWVDNGIPFVLLENQLR